MQKRLLSFCTHLELHIVLRDILKARGLIVYIRSVGTVAPAHKLVLLV
jgi:hypothetical protein